MKMRSMKRLTRKRPSSALVADGKKLTSYGVTNAVNIMASVVTPSHVGRCFDVRGSTKHRDFVELMRSRRFSALVLESKLRVGVSELLGSLVSVVDLVAMNWLGSIVDAEAVAMISGNVGLLTSFAGTA